MNKIKYVALNRAEGPSNECYAIVFVAQGQDAAGILAAIQDQRHMKDPRYVVTTDNVETAVLDKLRDWGQTAPKGGGYDKVDFEVGWEGGHTYSGRFDMEHGGTDGHSLFWMSLASRLGFYSLRRRPIHFEDNHWEHFVKQTKENGWDVECAKILDECAIGGCIAA